MVGRFCLWHDGDFARLIGILHSFVYHDKNAQNAEVNVPHVLLKYSQVLIASATNKV